ncbi:capsular polysaccharide biosynthesis protein [Roseinatronobacter thiooxidans]|nr:capsular polysaccharide biosynthesis protein [Roseinatronobacter thiooxidans]
MSPTPSARVYAYSGGFLGMGRQARRIRRIMALAGHPIGIGWPQATDKIAVWGHARRAARGEKIAARSGAGILRVEDAFLRSLFPGRAGEPTLGLLIDTQGAYYAPATPSDLETLLATHPLDDHALLERARLGMARLKALQLSKYAAHDPALRAPDPGYVLVVDQVRGDASLTHGGLDGPLPAHLFREMLVQAQLDFPGARIIIRTHPETAQGHRHGHFTPADATADHITLLSDPVSPWELLEGALAVYTVSSQLGFEAVFAGHKPRVFGLPFYAGWGLSCDHTPHPRRRRKLTRAQLFAAAMLLYPKWYDPCRDRLCPFEDALDHLEALTRAWREDRNGYAALNMRLWKRPHLQAFFGRWKKLHFAKAARTNQPALVWGMAAGPAHAIRIEDGFLRSRGLGAELTPPVSLVADDLGLYYDPSTPSRLEALIAAPPPPGGEARATALVARIRAQRLSKYNLDRPLPDLPLGHRILVPGQVEDDASIQLGAGAIRTNLALLAETRRRNPKAIILYKPHPDVEAGLRPGAIPRQDALLHADLVLDHSDPAHLLDHVNELWTMTSTMGFEALLRDVPVTTFGAPFYAGWGLTTDMGNIPARRIARPGLAALAHAALIAYPRYYDPVSRQPCPPEVALERLATHTTPRPPVLRLLAKLQGAFASLAPLWR